MTPQTRHLRRSTHVELDLRSPAVYAKVADGKIVYAQFMEDSFATARSFRSGGTWTISSDLDGYTIEV